MPGRRRGAVEAFALVLVTAPDLKVARRIAKACLETRAAACVNIIPHLESHYWWQGKLERGDELLLLMKTTKGRLATLETCVLANHPYDTPEFVVLPIAAGNKRYLDWICESVAAEVTSGH